MSQNMNDQWGQQPAQWQQPQDGQQIQPAPASSTVRNDLLKSLAIGVALVVFTLVMFIAFDRLFYVLPIFGVVIIIQGLVKFLKTRKNSPQDHAVQAWNAQQQGNYPPQHGNYPPQQGYYPPQQSYPAQQPPSQQGQPQNQHPPQPQQWN